MTEWDALPIDILALIVERIEYFEDIFNFYAVCKSWHSVTSILGKFHPLPSRYPWLMLTDKAEINFPKVMDEEDMNPGVMLMGEVRKNEQIEGMHNRQFYSFSASQAYEFELPEATLRMCLGLGYGLLLTLDYDLQINILNPFTRQQISMPNMLSFKTNYKYDDDWRPQRVINFFVQKVAISSNPYNQSNREDCITMAIYGEFSLLAFARPRDNVWTDICLPHRTCYLDVVYYNGSFHAVDDKGIIYVCDIKDANATPIAHGDTYDIDGNPNIKGYDSRYHMYLVESSGDLLLVTRYRKGLYYDGEEDIDRPYNYTVGFSIFKMEESCDGDEYPYKLTKVNNLGDKALFLGNNASVSRRASRCVKANCIYFCDDEVIANTGQGKWLRHRNV